jgi:hypothetical protein
MKHIASIATPEGNQRLNQQERVLQYLEEHGAITQKEALNELGVYRLASRIHNIKQRGIEVNSQRIGVRNRFGELCHVSEYILGGSYDS